MTETLTVERIEEIERGLEGVTPGPWEFVPAGNRPVVQKAGAFPHGFICNIESQHFIEDAAHIARLDPATIRALCTLARTALAAREGVQVKPLEWGKTSYGAPEVHTVVGIYRINEAINGGWAAVARGGVLRGGDGRTNFATLDSAKAAAQADYDSCIRSALTPAPAMEGEAVAWQMRPPLEDGRPSWPWNRWRECTEALAADMRQRGWSVRPLYAHPAPDRDAVEALEKLEKARDLFGDIRGDFSDPRSECREGMELIAAALRTLKGEQND